MANTQLAKLTAPDKGFLKQLTILEKRLAEVRTVEEAKIVATQAEVIAHAAVRMGVSRQTINQAAWVLIEAKVLMGTLLGAPPGKGVGGGRGKKLSIAVDSLSKDDIRLCRAAAWEVERDVREAYRDWLENHSEDHLSFRDIRVLARLRDLQWPVIKVLQKGKAKTLAEAVRIVRRRNIEDAEPNVPEGEYRCIVIDPPWPMVKIERDQQRPRQGDLEYQPMTLEQIAAFEVPAHETCHLYLWTTHRFLPHAFSILEGWKFDYVFTMVWHKSGGFQPPGLAQYNCEFALFGRRGGLGFRDTKDFFCCFKGKRRQHSRKPDEFYDVVERVSPGPRIDIFSREARDGFEQWGNEPEKF